MLYFYFFYRLYEEQVECMREKRIEQMSSRIDMIIAGKQKKLAVQGKSSGTFSFHKKTSNLQRQCYYEKKYGIEINVFCF